MKVNSLLTWLCMILTGQLSGQHHHEWYNAGADIYLQPDALLCIRGDLHMQGGTLTNHGLIQVEGNLHGNNSFQQRGTGVMRMHNATVNTTERQFISGNYAVRGGQAAIGLNDGSFYNLQLANSQGVVYLVGSGVVADVRNEVDFDPPGLTSPTNTLVTHNIGITGTITYPSNGDGYSATFGLMNASPGLGALKNNTITNNGNTSSEDNGYIIGKLRRAVLPAGGTYGYPIGLQPGGPTGARGVQYAELLLGNNNFDVVTGYFQSNSGNTVTGAVTDCNGYTIDYFGGADHGEWMFTDGGLGSGNYGVKTFPQDDNFLLQAMWMITRNDAAEGMVNQCAPAPVGAERSGYSVFGELSAFGLAGGSLILSAENLYLEATPLITSIGLQWTYVGTETIVGYLVERSDDGHSFIPLLWKEVSQHDTGIHSFTDSQVLSGINYFYKITALTQGGKEIASNIDDAQLEAMPPYLIARLYPNPTRQFAILHMESGSPHSLTIQVFNLLGELVWQQPAFVEGKTQVMLPAGQWASGQYMVRLTDPVNSQTLHLSVLR